MNLEEIGAFLKSERTKRHLTIDDVARQIKINPRLLTALESGNEAGLPHAAYVRGFIRSYGAFLGVGKEEIQALLDGVPRAENIKKPLGEEERLPEAAAKPGQAKTGSGSGGRFLVILLVLGALAGGGWWAWQNGYWERAKEVAEGLLASDKADREDKPAALEEKLPRTGASLAEGGDARESAPRPAPEREPEPAVAPIVMPGPVKPDVMPGPADAGRGETARENRSGQELRAGQGAYAAQAGQVVEPARHKLIITATEECWVHSNADKTDTRQFSLRKGDTFALTFSKSLELKLGNAGGVRLRYDGNDLPPPGASGQVKTITFPPRGGNG